MTKKILITGGAGFIGSHLVAHFLNAGHSVICLDNFLSGSRDNIKPYLENSNFQLIEHDCSLPLPHKISNLDAIFHFATPASPNP
ncbi:MAG: SDR family NAD-dependent epimerase/dehydratase, partial [bacterium]|nr:SDR family NAD-dependent epimerase/dehydratase [bacterium]